MTMSAKPAGYRHGMAAEYIMTMNIMAISLEYLFSI
jgi:hypothetical protein